MNYIFTKALIYPVDIPGVSLYDSLLVSGDKITLIGSYDDCRLACKSKAEIIDLGGRVLLPGFTDTHTHFTEYAKQQRQLNLSGCQTVASIEAQIIKYIEDNPVLHEWILGGSWDKNRLDSPERLTSSFLDRYFPDNPVALYSKDYHSRWCNSVSLHRAGISSASSDPTGGKIERDANGVPTGILYEAASDLINRFVSPISTEHQKEVLKKAINEIYHYGLTGINTMESGSDAELLKQIIHVDRSLRICRHFYLEELDEMLAAKRTSYSGDEWFKLGGVKIFADGALGSQTAAIFHEYTGSQGNKGILRHSREELIEITQKAAEQRISSTIHAIGDRAVKTVIDVFLHLKDRYPHSNLLSRIEHVQAIDPDDLSRLKDSGAYCSMQPVHLANDIPMIEKHWAPITKRAYCFKSLVDRRIPLGFGSDAPIETINPFKGIYSAIARKEGLDPNAPSWFPEQRISVEEALYAYTLGAAMGSDSHHYTGSLTPGKLADLIVLEDFSQLPNEYWLEASSQLTMLGGNIVYRDGI